LTEPLAGNDHSLRSLPLVPFFFAAVFIGPCF
jgi:hypothetical protein